MMLDEPRHRRAHLVAAGMRGRRRPADREGSRRCASAPSNTVTAPAARPQTRNRRRAPSAITVSAVSVGARDRDFGAVDHEAAGPEDGDRHRRHDRRRSAARPCASAAPRARSRRAGRPRRAARAPPAPRPRAPPATAPAAAVSAAETRARSARCRAAPRRSRDRAPAARGKRGWSSSRRRVVVLQRPEQRAQRAAPVGAVDDQLGDHRVVPGRDRVARAHAGVRAHASAETPDASASRSRAGSRAPRPRRRAAPRTRGRAARSRPASCGSGSPAATRSCHSTRSTPVIASVTGCSTCSRVFISMNQKPSGRRPRGAVDDELDGAGAASSRSPAPPRPPPRPSPRAPRRVMPGAGASSITFWWRRCSEQSRSNRCTALPWLSPNTWISMWRGAVTYFSTSTAALPKARGRLAARRGQRWRRSRAGGRPGACPCRRRPPPP